MNRPTLADVARQAHVSISTASAALSGGAGVSAVTRALVLRVADELSYRPSGTARSLRAGQHPIVGILTDPAFQEGQGDSPQVFIRSLLLGLAGELSALGALPMTLQATSASAPVDVLLVLDVGVPAPLPSWLNRRTPWVVAGILPLRQHGPVELVHDLPVVTAEVLRTLDAGPGSRTALLLPEGRMRHLQTFEESYLRWCAEHDREPQVIRFLPVVEQARAAGAQAVSSGAAALFLPSGRCEWSVLTGVRSTSEKAGRAVPVVALGEGVVEAEFGPSVGYLSLEGAECARVIARAVMRALTGEQVGGTHPLPWRLVAPTVLAGAAR